MDLEQCSIRAGSWLKMQPWGWFQGFQVGWGGVSGGDLVHWVTLCQVFENFDHTETRLGKKSKSCLPPSKTLIEQLWRKKSKRGQRSFWSFASRFFFILIGRRFFCALIDFATRLPGSASLAALLLWLQGLFLWQHSCRSSAPRLTVLLRQHCCLETVLATLLQGQHCFHGNTAFVAAQLSW